MYLHQRAKTAQNHNNTHGTEGSYESEGSYEETEESYESEGS